MSRDRVGIVAEVSGAIAALQGDIADMRQSVLRGYFTMILLARFPGQVSPEGIGAGIAATSTQGPVPLQAGRAAGGRCLTGRAHHAIPRPVSATARGRDRIGFVASVSTFCARNRLTSWTYPRPWWAETM